MSCGGKKELRYEEGGDAESGPKMYVIGPMCDCDYATYVRESNDLGEAHCYLCASTGAGMEAESPLRKVVSTHTVNPSDPYIAEVLECGHTII